MINEKDRWARLTDAQFAAAAETDPWVALEYAADRCAALKK